MRTESPLSKMTATLLFSLGVLWLALMAFASAWPDMEASVFDATTASSADERLRALRCPWVISSDEVARVRVKFTNPADQPASFLVRSRISRGFMTLVREDSQQVTLEPGESREISWPVTAADAAYGRIIMARVLAMRSAPRPARQSSCGILVLGLSGASGRTLFALGVFLGFLLLGAGAGGWWSRRRPLGAHDLATARRVGVLVLIIVTSLATGMMGRWLVSHLLLVASGLFALTLLQERFGTLS